MERIHVGRTLLPLPLTLTLISNRGPATKKNREGHDFQSCRKGTALKGRGFSRAVRAIDVKEQRFSARATRQNNRGRAALQRRVSRQNKWASAPEVNGTS
jgi:hypothetical protein